MVAGLGDMNLSLTFAAIGSAMGTGVAGMAAIGAWKKAFLDNKVAPFILVMFVGAPLTQLIYGMLLRNTIQSANLPPDSYVYQMVLGAAAGMAMGASAIFQGKAAARAADAYTETGKGFVNYFMVLGIIETVALFVMIFCMFAIPKV